MWTRANDGSAGLASAATGEHGSGGMGSSASQALKNESSHGRSSGEHKKEGFIHRLLHRHEGEEKAEKHADEANKLHKHH